MGHKFEIFTAGCSFCQTALKLLKEAICEKCQIIEYNLNKSADAVILAKKYNIKSVPSIVVDGELRFEGIPSPEEIKAIITDV
ncbi:MAG: thioredoxin family protein [Candidatus Heimdallarchaeota archaeon]